MSVYLHAKNPSQTLIYSRDIESQGILKSDWPRAFLTITSEPEFTWICGFCRTIRTTKKNYKKQKNHKNFRFRSFPDKTNDFIFFVSQKISVLGPFCTFFPEDIFFQNLNFTQKMCSVTFEHLMTI